jgi:integrase
LAGRSDSAGAPPDSQGYWRRKSDRPRSSHASISAESASERGRQGGAHPDEHIFLNGCQRPWNRTAFGRLFRKYACAAGVARGITPCGLRHLFTVLGIENGVGERQLADQLGHMTTKFVALLRANDEV